WCRQEQFHHLRSDQWRSASDGGTNPQTPIGILIPTQDLAGEGHSQGSEKEEHADDPGQLARILVGTPEADLDQMQGHDQHHAIRTPEVYGAEVPAEWGLVVKVLQRLVGLVGCRDIDQRQANAGDDLQHEEDEGGAAEDVPPAGGGTRHRMGDHRLERGASAQALVKPVGYSRDGAHRYPRFHTGSESVGICPPWTQSWPLRI